MKANILIIEDEKTFLNTLVTALKKEEYHVDGAKNEKEALEFIEGNHYDLIVSDVRLPGNSDGVEIVSKIKKLTSSEMGSIIMTGYANEDASIRAIEAKVSSYIKKPFELEFFLRKVKEVLLALEHERKDKSLIKDQKEKQRMHEEWGNDNHFLKDELCDLIVEVMFVNKIDIRGDSNFRADLGADSIDMSELIAGVEERFKIKIDEDIAKKFETVNDAFEYIRANYKSQK